MLQIRNQVIDLGNDFSITEDQDKLYSTMDFALPYIQVGTLDTTVYQKYDLVKLFYKEYDNEREAINPDITAMEVVFEGYIDRLELDESKGSGYNYKMFCKTTMGLCEERTMQTNSFNGTMNEVLLHADGYESNGTNNNYGVDFRNIVPLNRRIIDDFPEWFVLKLDGDKFFSTILESIKKKYAIKIFQSANGYLTITFPQYFSSDDITVFQHDMQSDVSVMNYGDLSQKYDSVICIGLGNYGLAFDPIAYQLKNGVAKEDLSDNVIPDNTKLNPFYIYRRDVFDQESAQQIAKNKLVEFAKNNSITFDTILTPTENINSAFQIKNSVKISEDQIYFIKTRTTTISKSGGIKCSISGYANSIIDFPEELLTPSTGLLDVDMYDKSIDKSTILVVIPQ